jgi:hypothetical protein
VTLDQGWEIWDRACDVGFRPTRRGDQALQTAIAFHGLVMNGGLDYAMDTDFELGRDAVSAFRYLDLPAVAATIEEAVSLVSRLGASNDEIDILELTDAEGSRLQELSERYEASDSDLEAAFRRRLSEDPEDFEPL